jgi:RimJ/RimL family protein N-acetyltransferase
VPLIPAPHASYSAILPLVPSANDAGHMAFVYGILEGEMPGTVFVDDADNPRTAIACNDCGFWHAVGAPRRDLVAESIELLKATLPAYPTQLYATTPEWAEALNPLFADHRSRNEYHFTSLPNSAAPLLPPGFELVPLSPALALKFEGAVDPWVVDIWGGPEQFRERIFGWAAIRGDELASFCTFCGLGGGETEIEVGTNERWRRLGLAHAVGHAFVRTALERGFRPAWTCTTGNTGSERLAAKLGFIEFRKVTGYAIGP